MISVTSEELERILTTVEEALALHDKWRERLLHNLVCRLPPGAADMAEDAHQHCAFGNWFYSKANAHFRELPAFQKIGELHQAMHQSARQVCFGLQGAGMVSEADYDRFLDSVSRFREEMLGLRQRVTHTLQNIDSLTGAYNHAKLLPDLRAAQQQLKAGGAPYSLLLMDIDLKTINQSQGRDVGDKVLRTAIASVRECLSAADKIYRYGGAEFVICLPGLNSEGAELIKETLLQKLGEVLAEAIGQAVATLRIHYGIVELNADAYLEELLDRSSLSTYTINI